jgi:L-rhamnose mutarotase
MGQVGLVWRIKAGKAQEYEARHARVWPELERLLCDSGVRTFHIYRWGEIVFGHMTVEDYSRLTERFSAELIAARWEAEFKELIEYPNADRITGWPERLRHVWSLNAGPSVT